MINLLPMEADNVVGFLISGKIRKEDIDRVLLVIEKKLQAHDKLRVYAEVSSIEGMAWGALLQDVRFSLKHFRDFEKEAIVSDKAWLAKLANVGDKLFPSIEVRHFPWAEKAQALEWIRS
ncbi:MAG: STAS/SEC14 domain-containing protein [Nitrospiria bacterium]